MIRRLPSDEAIIWECELPESPVFGRKDNLSLFSLPSLFLKLFFSYYPHAWVWGNRELCSLPEFLCSQLSLVLWQGDDEWLTVDSASHEQNLPTRRGEGRPCCFFKAFVSKCDWVWNCEWKSLSLWPTLYVALSMPHSICNTHYQSLSMVHFLTHSLSPTLYDPLSMPPLYQSLSMLHFLWLTL